MAQNAHSRREIRPAKANAAKRAIVESLEQGASRQGACEAAQVARRTFYNWLAEDEAFAERVAEAEAQAVETMESVVYACGLKAEKDPRYQRSAFRWLEQRGGWQRSTGSRGFDLTQCTDEELERIAHGEDPASVLASTRPSGGAARTEEEN